METVVLPMTLEEIADAVGGSVHDAEPDTLVTGPAQYDSRLLEPGGPFVAFQGQNVDGHDFASRAVAGGAVAVLAGRPVGAPAVVVDDVQAALGRLASVLVDRADGDLAVIGVTGSVGKTTDDVAMIADALSGSDRVSAGRMHVSEAASDVTVINDAYNSSPASTSAALRTAITLARGRRLVAVLGHMSELGPDSPQHHTELGSAAADAGVRYLIGVGNADAGHIVSTAVARGVQAEHVPDAPAALELVRRRWAAGDVVLVKGAHALGLESLAQQLEVNGATQDHANAERNGK
jgi:UDP-N-acetylmuramyl pentapeptide synthase